MKLLVGLGNPESQYLNTRHNAGWPFLDYLWSEYQFSEWQKKPKWHAEISKKDDLVLLKPLTYMNDSGKAVRAFLHFHSPDLLSKNASLSDVFIFHDDLDIEIGKWKLQFGSGPKVHNGITSVRDHLHTDQFWYGRIGVDGRQGDRSLPGIVYVLQQFRPEEKELLRQSFTELREQLNFLVFEQ